METENKDQNTSPTDKAGVSFNPLLSVVLPSLQGAWAVVIENVYTMDKQKILIWSFIYQS